MNNKIAKKKQNCLAHKTVIKQRTRKGFTPGDQQGIFYSLWCKVCNHHITMISHDEAWRAKKSGMPFENLNYKIQNSTYKSILNHEAEAQFAEYELQESLEMEQRSLANLEQNDNYENYKKAVGSYD